MNADLLRFSIAKRLFRLFYPHYVFSEWGNDWHRDRLFDDVSDRGFMLYQLVKLVENVPGAMAECGTYRGDSAVVLIRALARTLHVFDSFEGLSEPDVSEARWWRRGDFMCTEEEFLERFTEDIAEEFIVVHRGWIPERFQDVERERFCLVHVDVDLAEPTRECVEFFWPRVVEGGVMIFDDYGFRQCAEARRVIDGYFPQDEIIQLTTGQAFIVKKGEQ